VPRVNYIVRGAIRETVNSPFGGFCAQRPGMEDYVAFNSSFAGFFAFEGAILQFVCAIFEIF
jgi:hypothetical protein